MKYLLRLAVLAAVPFSMNTGAAIAAPLSLNCTPGSSGILTVSLTAGPSPETIEVSNAAGSTIGFHATLLNPAGTGGLTYSMGGGTILNFPGLVSAIISTPIAAPTYLMLESLDSNVTLDIVCNPDSGTPGDSQNSSQNPATSQQIVRTVQRRNLTALVHGHVRSATILQDLLTEHASYEAELQTMLSQMDFSAQERAELLESLYGEVFRVYAEWLVQAKVIASYPGFSEAQQLNARIYAALLEGRMEQLAESYRLSLEINSQFNYQAMLREHHEAIAAIEAAMSQTSLIENSFRALGYGSTGGFDGNAVIAQGPGWTVTASATAAVSQTRQLGGNTDSASGRASLNIASTLSPDTAIGFALSAGTTSEWGQVRNDTAWHYGADLVLAHQLSPGLYLSGGVGYELTSHNYVSGAATGSALSHNYAGWLGLSGDIPMASFMLTPSFEVELAHESRAAATLSDGSTVAGFDSTSGSATIGARISDIYLVRGHGEPVLVKPYLGVDAALTLTHRAVAQNLSLGYNLGLSGGVAVTLNSGATFDLGTRLSKSATTLGASVTGRVSASF